MADRQLYISGKQDELKLRILAERQSYKVGEEASVNLHSRGRAGTALLTWEADRILTYKLVTVKEGDNLIGWVVDGTQFPNFTLTAARMWENTFDEAKLDVDVERDLKVTVAPVKPMVGPGEDVELEVTAVDQLGRPAPAELSISVVDRSLLRFAGDRMPAIGSFFYSQVRTGAFSTEATNTFHYAPATSDVSRAVVNEAEQAAAFAANAAGQEDVRRQLNGQVSNNSFFAVQPAPTVPPPATADSPAEDSRTGEGRSMMMGGMGGGAGGGREGRRAGKQSGSFGGLMKKRNATGASSAKAEPGVEALGEIEEPELKDGADKDSSRLDVDGESRMGMRTPLAISRTRANLPSRQRFAETAYWNPSVVTGKDGKARVTFKAPSALSEYRIMARGVTGGDTLVGQTTATLTVRKNFFVDLKVPNSLTQGDKPRFIAQVHHLGVQGTVALKLAIYAGGRDEVFPKKLEIKGDGVEEVIFEPFEVPDAEVGPADAFRHGRRADGRSHDGDPDPALGRSGVCLGFGDQQ